MRSRQELLEASGYANRPRDFDDLIHILDPELRLITPTDPEGSSSEGQQSHTERAILPTHPRLSGSLPAGLADPQAKGNPSWTGGTRLAERSCALERQTREPASTVCLGMGEHQVADQEEGLDRAATRMMKRAGRVHGLRGRLAIASCWSAWIAVVAGDREAMATLRASALVESLHEARYTADVPGIVGATAGYRRWADPDCSGAIGNKSDDSRQNISTPASPFCPSMLLRWITSSTACSNPLLANFVLVMPETTSIHA